MKVPNLLRFPGCLALIPVLTLGLLRSATAGSATWTLAPISGDWNTAANWSPEVVPDGLADSATFASSNVTGVSLSAAIRVNRILFDAGASPFAITVTPTTELSLTGAGVLNSSGTTQNFVTAIDSGGDGGGTIVFQGAATAGDLNTFTNNGATITGQLGGQTAFYNRATAGSATFVNLGAGGFGTVFGLTRFRDSANAGTGTFLNKGSDVVGATGGATFFLGHATAGYATFTNDGPFIADGANGFTSFNEVATAGHGTFTNNGNAFANGFSGGVTFFRNSATADHGTFVTNGGLVSGAFGGEVNIVGGATAGFGTFITNGGSASGALRGAVTFAASTSADRAIFINGGGTVSGNTGGFTQFFSRATAGHATAVAGGGTVSGAIGGFTVFFDTATAGDSILTAQGGAVIGASRGHTDFRLRATAANATLIAEGGAGDDAFAGGVIRFYEDSDGGAARVMVFGNGNLDVSVHNAPGVTSGSIEGDGNVFLGANNLTIGYNDRNTVFSGAIQDGGDSGGAGGSLTKIGKGIVTLKGASTYTGGTMVSGGALEVHNASGSASGTGAVTVNGGGSLFGDGIISGAVTITDGGFLIPAANARATLTIQNALTFDDHSDYTYFFNASASHAETGEVIASGVTINSGATFDLGGQAHGVLPLGSVLTVIKNTAATPISGAFSNLPDGAIVIVNGNNLQASYEGGDGNDLTLTVVP